MKYADKYDSVYPTIRFRQAADIQAIYHYNIITKLKALYVLRAQ